MQEPPTREAPMQARQMVWAMPEALRVIVAGVGQQEPITQGRNYPLLVNLAAPQIQPLWAAFQERYLHPTVMLDLDPAQFGFLCDARLLSDKPAVELSIHLQPKEQHMAIGGQIRIPLEIPDDRRIKTRITTIPR